MDIAQRFFDLASQWRGAALALPFLAVLSLVALFRIRKDLSHIPGPFFASIFPFDRLLTAASGQQFLAHIRYHERFGPCVRVGPNHVSFSDADVIPQIYGITTKFFKVCRPLRWCYVPPPNNVRQSNFYALFDVRSDQGSIPTVFSIRDEAGHKTLKRPVANAYSMSALVELEPMTDDCIAILEKKFTGMRGKDVDLGEWLQWYAFDVITSITFSNRLGFMEEEKDVAGIINAIEGRLAYNAVIGESPTLHKFLLGNAVVRSMANQIPALARLNSARYIVTFAARQLERYKSTDKSVDDLRDMLARFKRSRDGEEVMTDRELLSHASSNMSAPSFRISKTKSTNCVQFCWK